MGLLEKGQFCFCFSFCNYLYGENVCLFVSWNFDRLFSVGFYVQSLVQNVSKL